jgi:hypothetical protein
MQAARLQPDLKSTAHGKFKDQVYSLGQSDVALLIYARKSGSQQNNIRSLSGTSSSRHVIVPNSGRVVATVAVLTFLSSWNAFLWQS